MLLIVTCLITTTIAADAAAISSSRHVSIHLHGSGCRSSRVPSSSCCSSPTSCSTCMYSSLRVLTTVREIRKHVCIVIALLLALSTTHCY